MFSTGGCLQSHSCPVKSKKFAQCSHRGNIYRPRKNGKSVEGCRCVLCKSENGYPQPRSFVDNPCGQNCGQCGKLRVINRYFDSFPAVVSPAFYCICSCIIRDFSRPNRRYVTAMPDSSPAETKWKSWNRGKKRRQNPSRNPLCKKIFVEINEKGVECEVWSVELWCRLCRLISNHRRRRYHNS